MGQIYYAAVEAVVGTKGAGLVVKGLSTGAKALIGVERLAALTAKISKFANALKQGVLAVVKVGRRSILFTNPSKVVTERIAELLSQIPANSKGRITMATAVVEDINGVRKVIISTSEPRGYLRPGVTLKEGEQVVKGSGHAEADIIKYAEENNLKVVDIGATRPVCPNCHNAIKPTNANISTPIKKIK